MSMEEVVLDIFEECGHTDVASPRAWLHPVGDLNNHNTVFKGSPSPPARPPDPYPPVTSGPLTDPNHQVQPTTDSNQSAAGYVNQPDPNGQPQAPPGQPQYAPGQPQYAPPPPGGYPPPAQYSGPPPAYSGYAPAAYSGYPPPPPPPPSGYGPPPPPTATVVYAEEVERGPYSGNTRTVIYTVQTGPPTKQEPVTTTQVTMVVYKYFEDPKVRRAFIRKVYTVLMFQLAVFAASVGAFVFVDKVNAWAATHFNVVLLFVMLYIIALLMMCCCQNQMATTNGTSITYFILVTISVSGIAAFFSSKHGQMSVFIALVVTLVIVLFLTLLAFQTKYDFTKWMGAMAIVVFGFFIFGILALILFRTIPIMRLLFSCVGAMIMCILILINTQSLMSGKRYSLTTESHLFGASTLFIDIVMLFLYILNIVDN